MQGVKIILQWLLSWSEAHCKVSPQQGRLLPSRLHRLWGSATHLFKPQSLILVRTFWMKRASTGLAWLFFWRNFFWNTNESCSELCARNVKVSNGGGVHGVPTSRVCTPDKTDLKTVFSLSGWPLGVNVQDVLSKRMASIADPEMDMSLAIKGDSTMRIQACLWCMRNPQLGCDTSHYCSGNYGFRIRGRR